MAIKKRLQPREQVAQVRARQRGDRGPQCEAPKLVVQKKHSKHKATKLDGRKRPEIIAGEITTRGVNTIEIAVADHRTLEIDMDILWKMTGESPLRYDKAGWEAIKTELLLLDNEDDDLENIENKLTSIVLKQTPRARPNAKAFWGKEPREKKERGTGMCKEEPQI
ncbi:hypothetical protein C7212DRAFT_347349 [Tuber magnatum]|uniref:Uncharacterized protein n=1 Tax=Tuber magnatum TaxID=42249 RepID=A0A317SEU1_9PEZI|nr:hypothetical protein C7212DRAFT_347349 [Tuber magnatum]